LHKAEQLASQDPLAAPADLLVALALAAPAGHIPAGGRILAQPGQRDHVQGAVELAVPATVDSLGRLGCQVAWLTMPCGVVRLAWGRSPRVQLRAVT
jgi:hypothetical protein